MNFGRRPSEYLYDKRKNVAPVKKKALREQCFFSESID